jgi:hypothetical protein
MIGVRALSECLLRVAVCLLHVCVLCLRAGLGADVVIKAQVS